MIYCVYINYANSWNVTCWCVDGTHLPGCVDLEQRTYFWELYCTYKWLHLTHYHTVPQTFHVCTKSCHSKNLAPVATCHAQSLKSFLLYIRTAAACWLTTCTFLSTQSLLLQLLSLHRTISELNNVNTVFSSLECYCVLNEGMKVWFLRSHYNSSRSGTVCNGLWDQHTPHISR